jgi:flagellar hook assembly protein FlgD
VRYWLSELSRSGETTWYGPATLAGTPVTALVLGRARPNPFAGSTAWRVSVPPGAGRVDLSVYDARGRRVRTLIDGNPGSGEFDVAWSGDTDGGGRAPAGLYFVRLRAGGEVRLQKIVRIP